MTRADLISASVPEGDNGNSVGQHPTIAVTLVRLPEGDASVVPYRDLSFSAT
jgi:hypothetical protein